MKSQTKYHWKDGWALQYPHPLPIKPLIFRERIYRCSCSGIYVYENRVCPLCSKKMEG